MGVVHVAAVSRAETASFSAGIIGGDVLPESQSI